MALQNPPEQLCKLSVGGGEVLISSILSQGNGRKQTEPETPLGVSGRDRSLASVRVPHKPMQRT